MHTHESISDDNSNPPRCPACSRVMLLLASNGTPKYAISIPSPVLIASSERCAACSPLKRTLAFKGDFAWDRAQMAAIPSQWLAPCRSDRGLPVLVLVLWSAFGR